MVPDGGHAAELYSGLLGGEHFSTSYNSFWPNYLEVQLLGPFIYYFFFYDFMCFFFPIITQCIPVLFDLPGLFFGGNTQPCRAATHAPGKFRCVDMEREPCLVARNKV